MPSFEHYKNQFFRAAEDAFIDYRSGSKEKSELFHTIFMPAVSKYERTKAALQLIREILPETPDQTTAYKEFFRDPSKLPFNTEHLEFGEKVGSGGQSDVYFLESKIENLPSYVLKILRKSTDSSENLEEYAKRLKNEYEKIRNIYAEVPNLIPKEFTLILENPQRLQDGAAVGLIQRFYGNDLKDIFRDISQEELVALAQEEPAFGDQLRKFIDTTLRHEKESGEVIDFFGLKNISIGKTGNKHELIVLDPHVIYSSRNEQGKEQLRTTHHLAYLESLQYQLQDSNQVAA